MYRFLGTSKKKETPSLSDAIASADGRIDAIDVKIKKLDAELTKYKDQLNRMRDGPAKNAVKQRALRVLQQKKRYEQQRDQIQEQIFGMEQTQIVTDNLKHAAATVDAMRQANKALKQQYKGMSIDKIERMQDEMEDLLEAANEVQEAMARSYGIPDTVDEADLEAELEALGDELLLEEEAVPSYLQPTLNEPMPEFADELEELTASQQPAQTNSETALKM